MRCGIACCCVYCCGVCLCAFLFLIGVHVLFVIYCVMLCGLLLLSLCAHLKFVLCLRYCVMFYGVLLFRVFVLECFCLICLLVSFAIHCVSVSGGFVCACLYDCVLLLNVCRLFASCCVMLYVLLLC